MDRIKKIAAEWAEQHGFDRYVLVSEENGAAVFHLFHSFKVTGKNGLPVFIRVALNGDVSDSLHWDYEEIYKYMDILKSL